MQEDYMPYESIGATRAAQLTFSEAAASVPSVQPNLSSGNMGSKIYLVFSLLL